MGDETKIPVGRNGKATKNLGRISIGFDCPFCSSSLKAGLGEAGNRDTCPDCNREFIVPGSKLRHKVEAEKAAAKLEATEKKSQEAETRQPRKPLSPESKSIIGKVVVAASAVCALFVYSFFQTNPDDSFGERLSSAMTGMAARSVILFFWAAVAFVVYWYFKNQKAKERYKQAKSNRIVVLQKKLKDDPHDKAIMMEMTDIAIQFNSFAPTIYGFALDAVQATHGDSTAKQFALDIGRIAHGFRRPDGEVTIYDEQAIQNDILARS